MPRVRTLDPGASPLHFFGAEVRHARMAAGMSQAELGSAAHCDGSVVSRVEAGLAEPPEGFAEACDVAFPDRGGFFSRFWRNHPTWSGPYPPWFLDWLGIERKAVTLRMWEPMLIPGLLQIPGYARAIFASWRQDGGDATDSKVAARIDRQRIFGTEEPPTLWVLVDESVLHRRVGTAPVMAAQLEHLAEMAAAVCHGAGRPGEGQCLCRPVRRLHGGRHGRRAAGGAPGHRRSGHDRAGTYTGRQSSEHVRHAES